MIKIIQSILVVIFITVFLSACDSNYQPKPRGYLRIELPEPSYQELNLKGFPYNFELSEFAKPVLPGTHPEKYWINIYYPHFKAQIHLTYKAVHHNLDTLLNDVHAMINKHIPKANAIDEQMYMDENKKVFGMAYTIKGSQAASPYQFYMTDSTEHFLRGALYFNFTPNNDSLKPIIQFLESDIQHLIESLSWSEENQDKSDS